MLEQPPLKGPALSHMRVGHALPRLETAGLAAQPEQCLMEGKDVSKVSATCSRGTPRFTAPTPAAL